ncbi:unnamed protein product, partial [Discosporangium mesarthrocarpum]
MQRRCAEVASDLSRSTTFLPVLQGTGQIDDFLRDSVGVLARSAVGLDRDVREVRTQGAAAVTVEAVGAACSLGPAPPEPLLRALGALCTHHAPARSTFLRLLAAHRLKRREEEEHRLRRRRREDALGPPDPLEAIFLLCLVHPHQATASAASALLQCLLVGGGALGAVSGPSQGASPGVGVIPAAYLTEEGPGGGGWSSGASSSGCSGLGREDPLQAELLDMLEGMVVTGARCRGGGGGSFKGSNGAKVEVKGEAAVGDDDDDDDDDDDGDG